MKRNGTVLVEVDGDRNQKLYFRPVGRALRGRFDAARVKGDAGSLAQRWPQPIPGQRVEVDLANGTAAVIEPLHDDANAALKEKITQSHSLPPAREELGVVDVPTFLYWLVDAVSGGSARLIHGSLPAGEIAGAQRTGFIVTRPPSDSDKLTAAIERQCDLMERLLSKLSRE